jgi:hypothetical protein
MNYRNSNRQWGSRDEPSVIAGWRRSSPELQAAQRKEKERKEKERKGRKKREERKVHDRK